MHGIGLKSLHCAWRGIAVAVVASALSGCATCGDRARTVWSINAYGQYASPDEVFLRRQMAGAVERHLNYPEEVCRKGLSGQVVVALRMDTDGAIAGVDLERSSGHADLDRVLLGAWQLAQRNGEKFTLPPSLRAAGGLRLSYGVNFAKP